MVRHEAVGHDPHPGEGLLVAEDHAEDLLVLGLEDPALVHDAGHDVVEGSSGSEKACGAHGVGRAENRGEGQRGAAALWGRKIGHLGVCENRLFVRPSNYLSVP